MINVELLSVGKDNFTRLKLLCENNAKVIPFIGAKGLPMLLDIRPLRTEYIRPLCA